MQILEFWEFYCPACYKDFGLDVEVWVTSEIICPKCSAQLELSWEDCWDEESGDSWVHSELRVRGD